MKLRGLPFAVVAAMVGVAIARPMYQRVVPDAIPCTKQGLHMGEKPFIKFYPSDFLGGTSGLSPAERGVYITLLCLMYEQDGSIPRDDMRLARRCGAPKAAFLRVLSALIDGGKITETGGRLFNRRAEKAIMDRSDRVEIAIHAASVRWAAQSGKAKENQSKTDAGAMPEQCRSNAIPEPEPDIRGDTNVSLALFAPVHDPKPPDMFDEFWDQYPHRGGAKKGKDKARQSWARLVKAKTPQGDIIAGALRYAQDRMVLSGYAKDPATWLNQKGWQDEIERADNRNGSGPSGSGNGMVAAFAAVAARATAKRQ